MSALIQIFRHALPLLAVGLGILVFNRLYDASQWVSGGVSPLFNLLLQQLELLLIGAWFIWLVWRGRQAMRHLLRVRRSNEGHEKSPVIYRILPRADSKPSATEATYFWNQLSDLLLPGQHVTFEISGDATELTYTIAAPDLSTAQIVVGQVVADWPGVNVQQIEDDPLLPDGAYAQTDMRPQLWTEPISSSVGDPVQALLLHLSRLPAGVRGGVVVKVRRDAGMRHWMQFNLARVRTQLRERRTRNHFLLEREKALQGRLSRPLFEVDVVAWAASASRESRRVASESRRIAQLVDAQLDLHCQTHARKGVSARVFPLLLGKPWNDRELALIAHLSVIQATQLTVAPAQTFVPVADSHYE